MHTSLEWLAEREHALFDNEAGSCLDERTSTDRYMELNYGNMGEDCEESSLREKRQKKVLSAGRIADYQPF